MHTWHSPSNRRASLPIIGLCLIGICLRLCSTLTVSHFQGIVTRETDTMVVQQSLIRQIERYQQIETGMFEARSLPVVPLDIVLAGTNESLSILAARSPGAADQIRPLFEQFETDLRAEADLIADGQFEAAVAFRQSGALNSGPALLDLLTEHYQATSARKSDAARKVKISLIVPTAVGSVFVCAVLIIYDQRKKRTHALLLRQETRFRSLIQQGTDIILVADIHGAISFATPSAEHAFGKSAAALNGAQVSTFVLPEDRRAFEDLVLESIASDHARSHGEVRFLLQSGAPRTMDVTAVNLIENDAVQGIVITAHDITERKMLLESLHHQAHHDSLTGLPNRLVLEDQLQVAIDRAQRSGSPISVLFVDLDDFKRVNDLFGHAVGDEVLIATADTLRGALRMDDTVARIGGDEFVILLEQTDRDYAVRVASRITDALADLRVGDRLHAQGASIGIVVTWDGALPADVVLQHADSAMYSVKATGKTGWHVFGEPAPSMATVA